MLARDGNVTGNRIGPARSSCAIHVGSYNQNRESIYVQQQTISAEGMSGIAFSTNVPHTVRGARTRPSMCTDCHVSGTNDNNAIMAQLLMQGHELPQLHRPLLLGGGRCGSGLAAVEVTERDEPQAVIGSTLHQLAYPGATSATTSSTAGVLAARPRASRHGHQRALPIRCASRKSSSVQLRGEYLYAACGEGGLRVFDIAFIDDKGFSERITTAPVSPLGPAVLRPTKYADRRRRPDDDRPRSDAHPSPRRTASRRSIRHVRLHLRRRQVTRA